MKVKEFKQRLEGFGDDMDITFEDETDRFVFENTMFVDKTLIIMIRKRK